MQRFLIIKLLTKRLILTNAGVAPSGIMGLGKPPGSLLPAYSLLAYHCGLLEYGTCLEKMPFSESDSACSLWMRRESSKNINTYWPAFQKANTSTCFSWQVSAPLIFCQSRVLSGSQLGPVDSKALLGMWEEGGLTRIGQPSGLTDSLGTRGIRGQSPKGRAHSPRDDCMKTRRRSCYMFGTKSFSGDWKTLAGFHDADQC